MSMLEVSHSVADNGRDQYERLEGVDFTLLELTSALQTEAVTEEEATLAASASAHVDLFIQKWYLHLQERLLIAKESEKRFPTLQGYTFVQWASYGGPLPIEEKGQERFVKPRILGREFVKNGHLIRPSIDYINRVLYSINAIGQDQDIISIGDEAARKGYKMSRWMEYIKPPVSLPTPHGEELCIDVDRRTVDLLMPINKLPLLTGVQPL